MHWFHVFASVIMELILCVLSPFLYAGYYLRSLPEEKRSGKIVLITGCSSGLGKDLALHLAHEGVQTFAGCRRQESVAELSKLGISSLHPIKLDVTNDADLERAMETIKLECGGQFVSWWIRSVDFVDDVCDASVNELVASIVPYTARHANVFRGKNVHILFPPFTVHVPGSNLFAVVCNAGVQDVVGPVQWLKLKHYEDAIKVNFIGQVRTVATFLPLLIASRGRLVFSISSLSHVPGSLTSPYAASKSALWSFARCIRFDLAKSGVHVVCVTPGFFKSNLNDIDRLPDQMAGWLDEEQRSSIDSDNIEELLRYARILSKYLSETNENSDVTRAFCKAIFSKHPRDNYWVGGETVVFRIMKIMPEFVMRYVVVLGDRFAEFLHRE